MIPDLRIPTTEWTNRANDEMSLMTMIDELYKKDGIAKTVPIPITLKYEPIDGVDYYALRTLYSRHKELLNDIVSFFFHNLLFVPRKISTKDSSEFFMFTVIHDIYLITWYQEIENSKDRGYTKEKEKIDKALEFIRKYSDYDMLTEFIYFPKHQNATISYLSTFLKEHRPRQEEKIIKAIKEYFDIKSLKETNDMKTTRGNREVLDILKQRGIIKE